MQIRDLGTYIVNWLLKAWVVKKELPVFCSSVLSQKSWWISGSYSGLRMLSSLHESLLLLIPTQMASAMGFRTWLWHQIYQTRLRVTGQQLRVYLNVPLPGDCGQLGDSVFSPRFGQNIVHCLDKEFYALWLCPPEICPCDFSVLGLLPPCSGTILPQANYSAGTPSTTSALTSSWTSLRPFFPLAFSFCGVGKVPRPALPRVTAPNRTLWHIHNSVWVTACWLSTYSRFSP